ncbi:alpha/beta hydrolase family protein [Mycetocola miduiensis]|uniref:Lysophospholipase, alpha-beta hydrolase superfamily n=1 Tax=Mycetocola miduiensis TaxID=995034 RepID=A0A1I5CM97_9MICO|nr:alpha/beta fold hydrolase [Mycetocola miduiensis]SFN88155.1 Lysophospholipase, alpha-beta hydrolase superfamily [Mycetocola miduiensis]
MKRHSHAVRNGPVSPARNRRLVVLFGGILLTLATSAVIAVGTVARRVVTPARTRFRESDVLAIDAENATITLGSNPDTKLPGRYGLFYGEPERYLRLGDVLSTNGGTVTRRLETPADHLPASGPATFSGWYYSRPEELGLDFTHLNVPTHAGNAPAWLFPAEEETGRWVVIVHGRGTTRSECLRAVPVWRDAGYSALLVSYRNDGDAPPSADGLYRLGDTEWEDVDAALDLAAEHGASDVVLMGWSMGGTIAVQTALRSAHKGLLRGIALESPVLDWARVLEFQADAGRIPVPLRLAAILAITSPWGRALTGLDSAVNLPGLDVVSRADELTVPVLVLHSDDDGFVPSSASHDLAAARPDLVTFSPFTGARHTKLWNYDEDRWTSAISDWAATLG